MKNQQIKYPFFNLDDPNLIKACNELIEMSFSDLEQMILDNKCYGAVIMQYTHWCNNIGNGVYIPIWSRFHWLQGIYLKKSSVCNQHSIRYYFKTPADKVLHHGALILKRHAKRYLKEINYEK